MKTSLFSHPCDCLFAYLSVCGLDISKSYTQIFMKFGWKFGSDMGVLVVRNLVTLMLISPIMPYSTYSISNRLHAM